MGLLAYLLAGCGYQPVYGSSSGGRFHVHLAESRVSSVLVAQEVVRGARDELATEGSLAPGDGFPRLEIEVLRADESSEGVVQAETPEGPVPRARATELGVVARAWIVRREGAPAELDTGDMAAESLMGSPLGDPTREVWQREDSLRATARRLGGRLVLRVLGHPTVTVSPD